MACVVMAYVNAVRSVRYAAREVVTEDALDVGLVHIQQPM